MNKIINECVERLEILKKQGLETDINIVEVFKKGSICISEPNMVFGMPCGVIFNIENKPYYKQIFEDTIIHEMKLIYKDITPYFGIVQNTSFGLLFSVFYVSHDEQEWEQERYELENKDLCVYVFNIDDSYGEFGYIKYEMFTGGPIRTA